MTVNRVAAIALMAGLGLVGASMSGCSSARSALGMTKVVPDEFAVVIGLAAWVRRGVRPLTALAIGLVMGGAIGNNVIDRVRWGAVADFLDFSGLGFKWVFNVADSAITVGVALLLLEMVLSGRAPRQGAR